MELLALLFCLLITEMVSGLTLSRISSIPTPHYNHPSFTDSADITELLEQALIEQLQPFYVCPPNDYQPYSQAFTTQPPMEPKHQIVPNAKAYQCDECDFNRIVSNPFVQDIMNSNLILSEPVVTENPMTASNNFAGNVPQVVNNYIIVPPEYMTNDGLNRKQGTDANGGSKRRDRNKPYNGGNKRKKLNDDNEPGSECTGCERRKQYEKPNKKNTREGTTRERGKKRKRLPKTERSDKEQSRITNNDTNIQFESKGNTMKNVSNDEAFIQDFRKRFPSLSEEDMKTFLCFVRNRLKKKRQNNLQSEPESDNDLLLDENFVHQNQDSKNNKKRHTHRKSGHSTNENTQSSKSSQLDPTPEDKNFETEDTKSYESLDIFDYAVPKLNTKLNQGIKDIEETSKNAQNSVESHEKVVDNDIANKKPVRNEVAKNKNSKHYQRNKNTHRNKPNKNRLTTAKKINTQPKNRVNKLTSKHDSNKISNDKFRASPVLERPGFRTKAIMKNNFKDTNRQYEKYSTYSDIKQGTNVETYFKEAEKQEPNIETFYGHSKVVKYGGTDKNDEDYEARTVTYYIPDDMEFEDDGKSVIITRRIPNTNNMEKHN